MSGLGNASPVRANLPEVQYVMGVWTGAGAADLTHTSTDWSAGISSVDQTATGKYTIHLSEWGQQIVDASIEVLHTTAAAKQHAGLVKGTFSTSAGTVDFEVFTAATGVLADVVSGDKVLIKIGFVKKAPG